MNRLVLVAPNIKHKTAVLEYRDEHYSYGENELHGSALLDKISSYEEWLEHIEKNANENTVSSDWVISSTLFAIHKDSGKIIGMIDIRHTLNDFLQKYGGHIGYGVRPSERRKGYATEILGLGLEYCKTINLTDIMLSCYKDNIASGKTILNNGGIPDREFVHTDGKTVQVYWIKL